MTKIVINNCYGGFGLSEAGMRAYAARKGVTLYPEKTSSLCTTYWTVPAEERVGDVDGAAWSKMSIKEREDYNRRYDAQRLWDAEFDRDDPDLVAVVEELGSKANDQFANLRVVEIPDGVDWQIEEYDGLERVSEAHRTWG